MNFTKEEIEKSIENLDRSIKALRAMILEEGSSYMRSLWESRYDEAIKRKKELEEMLK